MALDAGALEDAILAFLNDTADDASAAADALAEIYATYAADGTFGASTVTIDGARESALAATLLGGLAPSPSAAAFLTALSSGLGTFWTGAPVVGAQSGATNGCPGAASLPAALAPILAVPNSREDAAGELAGALHTATATVTATVSPPPATVLPIA
jgi:hypothetical protein